MSGKSLASHGSGSIGKARGGAKGHRRVSLRISDPFEAGSEAAEAATAGVVGVITPDFSMPAQMTIPLSPGSFVDKEWIGQRHGRGESVVFLNASTGETKWEFHPPKEEDIEYSAKESSVSALVTPAASETVEFTAADDLKVIATDSTTSTATSTIPTTSIASETGVPVPTLKTKVSSKLKMAIEVIQEMVNSEISYVEGLVALKEVFWNAILENLDKFPGLVDVRVVLFYHNTREIIMCNSKFLDELFSSKLHKAESNLNEFDLQRQVIAICELLSYYSNVFKLYGQYSQNYGTAIPIIQSVLDSDKAFQDLMGSCQANPKVKGQTLLSLLITPIQRIPRYVLLLKELSSKIDKDWDCRHAILKCILSLEATASYVNEWIRDRENREKLAILEKSFASDTMLLKSGRCLVREGFLVRITKKSDERKVMFHLFNDMITYSEETTRGLFKLKKAIPLDIAKKFDLADDAMTGIVGSNPTSNAFVVRSTQKSYVVICASREERDSWVEDYNRCITEIYRKLNIQEESETSKSDSKSLSKEIDAPIWARKSKKCYLCDTYFGLTNRRKYCNKCGLHVCKKCSDFKMLLPMIDPEKELRVCFKCKKLTDARQEKEMIAAANFIKSTKDLLSSPGTVKPMKDAIKEPFASPLSPREAGGTMKMGSTLKKGSILRSVATSMMADSVGSKIEELAQKGKDLALNSKVAGFIEEERIYLQEMQINLEEFIIPLLALIVDKKIVFKKVKERFNIPSPLGALANALVQLSVLHRAFLEDLVHHNKGHLGRCFDRFAYYSEIYETLYRGILSSDEVLKQSAIESFIVKTEERTFRSFRVVLRYPLLRYKQICDFVFSQTDLKPIFDQCSPRLKRSLEEFSTLEKENTSIDELELLENFFDLNESKLKLVNSSRKFIREGFVNAMMTEKGDKGEKEKSDKSDHLTLGTWQRCYSHLFDNLLLLSYSKPFPNGWKVMHEIELSSCTLLPSSAKHGVRLKVSAQQKGKKKEVVETFLSLQLNSEDELADWLKNLMSAISPEVERTSTSPKHRYSRINLVDIERASLDQAYRDQVEPDDEKSKSNKDAPEEDDEAKDDGAETASEIDASSRSVSAVELTGRSSAVDISQKVYKRSIDVIEEDEEVSKGLELEPVHEEKEPYSPTKAYHPKGSGPPGAEKWSKFTDPAGLDYWYNSETKETTYVDPFHTWTRHLTTGGTEFWYNKDTLRSTFTKPVLEALMGVSKKETTKEAKPETKST